MGLPIQKNQRDIVAKVKVLPPRNLYIPLLPTRMNNRLIFALCRTCCEQGRDHSCDHENPEDRCFTGTWVSLELEKAFELGYKILEVYIVWSYDTTQYDKKTKKEGLFAGYIDLFLKSKQEACGFPPSCVTEDDKDQYIREYYDKEGILLGKVKIVPNAALKAFSKATSVASWGKLCQRSCLKQTEIIKSEKIF